MVEQDKKNSFQGLYRTADDFYSFQLHLFPDTDDETLDSMRSLWLPKTAEGFFRFPNCPELAFLSISAKSGRWVAVCKNPAFFQDVPISQSYEIPLSDGQLLKISFEEKTYFLYVEKVFKEFRLFKNYHFPSHTKIKIGNNSNNDIYYINPYISSVHAVISHDSGYWELQNNSNYHGVFVNGKRALESTPLSIGDLIFIMGLKFIIGPNFLSISSGSGKITINHNALSPLATPTHTGYSNYYNQDSSEEKNRYFNRYPRKHFELEHKTISVDGPPMSMAKNQMPLVLRMGGSMVMSGAAAMAGNYTMLLSSVLFPFLSSKYTEQQRQEYEKLRLRKYTEYLEAKKAEISSACASEQKALNQMFPLPEDFCSPVQKKSRLWERRPTDNDFLQLRLGTGQRPLSAEFEYPEKRFELDSDDLEDKMYQLVEKTYFVQNAPILLSLIDTPVSGILGSRKVVLAYVLRMAIQTAFFHSYDEVKMIFLVSEEELEYLKELRYLPHVWDDLRTIRLIATNDAEAYAIGDYIKSQTEEENTGSQSDLQRILKKRPYYVIFALEKKLLDGHEVIKDIIQSDENIGVSVIAAFDELPKEAKKIILLKSDGKNIYRDLTANGGDDISFSADQWNNDKFRELARTLANTSLKAATQVQEMPKMVTFLDMFQAGRLEQLNPLKRWRENNPVASLATPVGVGADGSLFTLDLHEKRQGPHGLVAGMTGSGKSEFIITYILSMAVNYHPDEVAFVLIDYKGGGLAGAFENPHTGVRLPHLAGTITNLDGASIQRSMISIESELIRRQKVFNEVKSTVNEGTMDIYAYQKLYRAGKVSEPMPHLFIISDEFAELKQQQPEFMASLISAARIGRSLGIHLILATQKPSGIVDDQIRSNTKFRVCLRVQERSDSMDMLKRPEAAELTDTGRFYLQVGYNEYFALGQSAWCGAPYEPQDKITVQHDDSLEFIDTTGQVIAKARSTPRKTSSGMTQIVAVVKYLSDLAASQGISSRQLCLPELPKSLDFNTFQRENGKEDNAMSICLGLLDDPENQQQFPLKVDFGNCQNLLITGSKSSGKTVMAQNILYALSKKLSPQDFNFYVLDYSSRLMKLFKPLPHCGAVLCEEDSDSLDEFFKLINLLVAERKRIFSELEVDSFEAALSKKHLPLVLVVIDNISGLNSSKSGEAHSYKLHNYMKNSANYGIKYVVTCSHMNEVPSRIRTELPARICLHVKDKYDYNELLGCKVSYLPPELPGRGLYKTDERALEFQGSLIQAAEDDKGRTAYVKSTVEALCSYYKGKAEARHMPVISENATYQDFCRQFSRGRIPLGYSRQNNKPVALPLKQFSALSLYFGNPLGIKPVIENFIYAAAREDMELWVIIRKENSLFDNAVNANPEVRIFEGGQLFSLENTSLDNLRSKFISEISYRNKLLQGHCEHESLNGQPQELYKETFNFLRDNTKPIMLLIENMADFCESMDTMSSLVFDKCFSVAQLRNIYVIACFEPDDYKRITSRLVYYSFNLDSNVMMFGGQFDKQDICTLPDVPDMGKMLQYNMCLMNYQSELHPLIMPCGELLSIEVDEDEQSIF